MALAIITADQRINSATVKGQVWGVAGVGKTTLLKTLDAASTLCLDFEAGLLSVQRDDKFGPSFRGDSVKVENWQEAQAVLETFKTKAPFMAKYRTVFVDSTTIASKQCFEWCQQQPEAFSEKTGKPNLLGAYGLLSREMVSWTQGWKYLDNVNVWLVGGLERKENDVGTKEWLPLIMGSKLANELPYIMDYCLVMARFKASDGQTYTGLFTDPIANPEYATVPVKTRGGNLDPIEQPHLGRLMTKALGQSSIAPPPSVAPTTEPGGGTTPPTTTESEAA